jgi:ATP/maltotriose-dependent transcriptional regulator MalT
MSVLEVISNRTNLEILKTLKAEPTYPRRLASLLSMTEQKVVPRLRNMEKAGLLRSSWGRIENKNVKLYEVSTDKVEILLGAEGVELVIHPGARRQIPEPPLYIPPRLSHDDSFVGRETELEILNSKRRFVVIEGIGGIGKSSLLQTFVLSLPARTRVFWHSFKETDSFSYVLTRLASFLAGYDYLDLIEYLRGAGNENSTKLELALKGLNRPNYVLVFDDYQRQHDIGLDTLLGEFQRNITRAKIVVASRERPRFMIPSLDALEIALDGLNEEECTQYLERKNVRLDEQRRTLVYRKTSGHPLSLVVMCSILLDDKTRLEELSRAPAIEELVSQTLDSLDDDQRNVLLRASVFRDPIPIEGVLALAKGGRVRASLHALERKLILKRTDGSYLLHELIREGGYRRIDRPEELHRMAGEWFLARGTPQDTLEGIYQMISAGDFSKLNEIMARELVEERFHFVEEGYDSVLLDILNPVQANRLKPRDACCLLCVQAKALTSLQKWSKARQLLREARQIAVRLNDKRLLSCVHKTIGNYYVQRGDLLAGEKHLIMSSDLLRSAGDSENLERIYLSLAKLHFLMGDVRGSLSYIDSRDKIVS